MKLLIYGFITGVIFGFLLQKARVVRYEKQIGALRLLDMTVIKFMFSAILVGMIGLYILKDLGLIQLKVKTTILGANIIGGLLFGIGWGLLGYCPGTQVGALGEGRWDALWGILGMLLGGLIFAEVYPILNKTVLTWGDLGKITIPQVFGIYSWIIIPIFIMGGLLLLSRKSISALILFYCVLAFILVTIICEGQNPSYFDRKPQAFREVRRILTRLPCAHWHKRIENEMSSVYYCNCQEDDDCIWYPSCEFGCHRAINTTNHFQEKILRWKIFCWQNNPCSVEYQACSPREVKCVNYQCQTVVGD